MVQFKHLFVALLVLAMTAAFSPASASTMLSEHRRSNGDVIIQVVDQDGVDMGGVWFLHEGTGDKGSVIRNGTYGEAFRLEQGTYFLRGQNKKGYEDFQVTSENPQAVIPRGTVVFTLAYYKEGYAASQQAEESGASLEVTPVNEPTAAPDTTPTAEPEPEVMEPNVMEPLEGLLDDGLGITTELFDRSHLERSPLPSPGVRPRVSTTALPVTTQAVATAPLRQYALPATGPAGLLGLMVMSGLGGLWATRRRYY
ncbi:MAG: hypothetical protein V1760_02615 [Candidatus Peregrinibacteria bacterium]